MVRPRKIPRNFEPVEWSDSDSELSAAGGDPIEVPAPVIHDINNDDDVDVDEDSEDQEEEDLQIQQPIDEPLEELAKQWLLIEMSHSVSKTASDEFWKAAQTFITKIYSKKKCKNQSFTHLRRQLMRRYCPDVCIDLAYKNTKTGEISIERDVRKISHAKFRKPDFEPLHEIASIKVSKNIQLSFDGKNLAHVIYMY